MDAEEVAASSLAVLEHLMVFPPKYTSLEYNGGVGILFKSIRDALKIDEPKTYEIGCM